MNDETLRQAYEELSDWFYRFHPNDEQSVNRLLAFAKAQRAAEALAIKESYRQWRESMQEEVSMCYGGCECERCHPSEMTDAPPTRPRTSPRRTLTSPLDRVKWTDVTSQCQLGPAVGCTGVTILIRLPNSTVKMDLLHPANRGHFHLAYDRTFRVWTDLEEYAS